MKIDYQKIIDFILVSGDRLRKRTGNVDDIGITKKNLTEEDLAIERGLKEIVTSFGDNHMLYAEEENDLFQKSDNVWIVDPISGTANFIKGLPYYSIVISHVVNRRTVFAAVYNPSADELFTAYEGRGAFLNEEPIKVSDEGKKIILRESSAWKQPEVIEKSEGVLKDYELEKNTHSMAINYCAVAAGRYDGIISFTKDTFSEFAGGFIVRAAGGNFTNLLGESEIKSSDRIFIGGNKNIHKDLLYKISKVL